MAASPVPIGQTFAGKYRVDRVLGEGGMGVVVAAYHTELEQPVAIKFLLDDLQGSAEGAERFRREARAAAKIQSDHVVRVLDVGVLDSGERYMVMEYLDGHDLAEELAARGQLPVGVAAGYLLEALDAVGHAHAVGIVHRDLKPANLFLARRPDGRTRIKVLDFGISKTFGAASSAELSLTKTSAWIGSPLYMSPEQMQSARDVDHRADIWSLGAILYEMIAGRPPYLADSLPQLCNLLLTRDPEPITDLVPGVPLELADAIHRCLARNLDERMRSTADLARVLGRFATTTTGSSMAPQLLARTEALGPPVSVQSAAARMASMAPTSMGPASLGPSAFGPSSRDGAAARVSMPSVPGELGATPSTAAAWGATQQGASPGRSRAPLVLALGAALLGIGVGAFLLGRSSEDRSTASEPTLVAPVVGTALEVPSTPVAASSMPVAAPAVSSVLREVGGTVDAPPEVEGAVAKTAPTPSASPSSRVGTTAATTVPRVPKAPSKAATKNSGTSASADESDFGGRR